MSYTPGPWMLEGTTVYALAVKECPHGIMCECNRFSATFTDDASDALPAEILANAKAAAAVPDLMEALKESKKVLDVFYARLQPGSLRGDTCSVIVMIDAALEKAGVQ